MSTLQTQWKKTENGVFCTLRITCHQDGSIQMQEGDCPDHTNSSTTFPNKDEALRHLSEMMHEGTQAL